mmetsp:Transcript_5662/g.15026  ORF Transcript_5662/g.15026 Transcript_5662/m.15026 type:complete len:281 (-) Transcript_5662:138-980(-)
MLGVLSLTLVHNLTRHIHNQRMWPICPVFMPRRRLGQVFVASLLECGRSHAPHTHLHVVYGSELVPCAGILQPHSLQSCRRECKHSIPTGTAGLCMPLGETVRHAAPERQEHVAQDVAGRPHGRCSVGPDAPGLLVEGGVPQVGHRCRLFAQSGRAAAFVLAASLSHSPPPQRPVPGINHLVVHQLLCTGLCFERLSQSLCSCAVIHCSRRHSVQCCELLALGVEDGPALRGLLGILRRLGKVVHRLGCVEHHLQHTRRGAPRLERSKLVGNPWCGVHKL